HRAAAAGGDHAGRADGRRGNPGRRRRRREPRRAHRDRPAGVPQPAAVVRQDLAALNVPLRRGLDVAETLQPRLDHVRKVMQLAFDLGARRVVVPGPKVPDDAAAPRAQLLRESLLALGPFGDRIGTVLALEIGFDPAEKVKQYLAGFDTGSLKVTYDPANMLMHGHDPLASLAPLKNWIAHVHARDARSAGLSRGPQEGPLGAGDIDWMAFTATLQVLDFDGFLTVEREQGENKLA